MDVFDAFKLVIQIDQIGGSVRLSDRLRSFSELYELVLHLTNLRVVVICVDLLPGVGSIDFR